MKPQVFIGSSSEGLDVAYSIQSNLEDAGEVTVWTQDVFEPSDYTLESLIKMLDSTDVCVFVFAPDDVVKMRGTEQAAVRDNVIFEFGLSLGRLGRERSVMLAPKGAGLHLPSDLLGVTMLTYNAARQDKNLAAALGPACNSLRKLLKEIQPRDERFPVELLSDETERRDQLSPKQRQLLEAIESRGRCSKEKLHSLFQDMSDPELHYRLEQLRLLMFIKSASASNNAAESVYELTHSYRTAISRRRTLPMRSKPIDLGD